MFESDDSGDDFDNSLRPHSFKTKEEVPFKLWALYFVASDKERNPSLTTILEKEFIKLKGIYCFLDETQIMGKTLTKLGIPNVCGKANKKALAALLKLRNKSKRFEGTRKTNLNKPYRPLQRKFFKSKSFDKTVKQRYAPVVERWSDIALKKFKIFDDHTFSAETYTFGDQDGNMGLLEDNIKHLDAVKCTNSNKNQHVKRVPTTIFNKETNKLLVSQQKLIKKIRNENGPKDNSNTSTSVVVEPVNKLSLKLFSDKFHSKKSVRFNDEDLCDFAPTQVFKDSLQQNTVEETGFDQLLKSSTHKDINNSNKPKPKEIPSTYGNPEFIEENTNMDSTLSKVKCSQRLITSDIDSTKIGKPYTPYEPFEIEPYSTQNIIIEDWSDVSSTGGSTQKSANDKSNYLVCKGESSTKVQANGPKNQEICNNTHSDKEIHIMENEKCDNYILNEISTTPLSTNYADMKKGEGIVIEGTPTNSEQSDKELCNIKETRKSHNIQSSKLRKVCYNSYTGQDSSSELHHSHTSVEKIENIINTNEFCNNDILEKSRSVSSGGGEINRNLNKVSNSQTKEKFYNSQRLEISSPTSDRDYISNSSEYGSGDESYIKTNSIDISVDKINAAGDNINNSNKITHSLSKDQDTSVEEPERRLIDLLHQKGSDYNTPPNSNSLKDNNNSQLSMATNAPSKKGFTTNLSDITIPESDSDKQETPSEIKTRKCLFKLYSQHNDNSKYTIESDKISCGFNSLQSFTIGNSQFSDQDIQQHSTSHIKVNDFKTCIDKENSKTELPCKNIDSNENTPGKTIVIRFTSTGNASAENTAALLNRKIFQEVGQVDLSKCKAADEQTNNTNYNKIQSKELLNLNYTKIENSEHIVTDNSTELHNSSYYETQKYSKQQPSDFLPEETHTEENIAVGSARKSISVGNNTKSPAPQENSNIDSRKCSTHDTLYSENIILNPVIKNIGGNEGCMNLDISLSQDIGNTPKDNLKKTKQDQQSSNQCGSLINTVNDLQVSNNITNRSLSSNNNEFDFPGSVVAVTTSKIKSKPKEIIKSLTPFTNSSPISFGDHKNQSNQIDIVGNTPKDNLKKTKQDQQCSNQCESLINTVNDIQVSNNITNRSLSSNNNEFDFPGSIVAVTTSKIKSKPKEIIKSLTPCTNSSPISFGDHKNQSNQIDIVGNTPKDNLKKTKQDQQCSNQCESLINTVNDIQVSNNITNRSLSSNNNEFDFPGSIVAVTTSKIKSKPKEIIKSLTPCTNSSPISFGDHKNQSNQIDIVSPIITKKETGNLSHTNYTDSIKIQSKEHLSMDYTQKENIMQIVTDNSNGLHNSSYHETLNYCKQQPPDFLPVEIAENDIDTEENIAMKSSQKSIVPRKKPKSAASQENSNINTRKYSTHDTLHSKKSISNPVTKNIEGGQRWINLDNSLSQDIGNTPKDNVNMNTQNQHCSNLCESLTNQVNDIQVSNNITNRSLGSNNNKFDFPDSIVAVTTSKIKSKPKEIIKNLTPFTNSSPISLGDHKKQENQFDIVDPIMSKKETGHLSNTNNTDGNKTLSKDLFSQNLAQKDNTKETTKMLTDNRMELNNSSYNETLMFCKQYPSHTPPLVNISEYDIDTEENHPIKSEHKIIASENKMNSSASQKVSNDDVISASIEVNGDTVRKKRKFIDNVAISGEVLGVNDGDVLLVKQSKPVNSLSVNENVQKSNYTPFLESSEDLVILSEKLPAVGGTDRPDKTSKCSYNILRNSQSDDRRKFIGDNHVTSNTSDSRRSISSFVSKNIGSNHSWINLDTSLSQVVGNTAKNNVNKNQDQMYSIMNEGVNNKVTNAQITNSIINESSGSDNNNIASPDRLVVETTTKIKSKPTIFARFKTNMPIAVRDQHKHSNQLNIVPRNNTVKETTPQKNGSPSPPLPTNKEVVHDIKNNFTNSTHQTITNRANNSCAPPNLAVTESRISIRNGNALNLREKLIKKVVKSISIETGKLSKFRKLKVKRAKTAQTCAINSLKKLKTNENVNHIITKPLNICTTENPIGINKRKTSVFSKSSTIKINTVVKGDVRNNDVWNKNHYTYLSTNLNENTTNSLQDSSPIQSLKETPPYQPVLQENINFTNLLPETPVCSQLSNFSSKSYQQSLNNSVVDLNSNGNCNIDLYSEGSPIYSMTSDEEVLNDHIKNTGDGGNFSMSSEKHNLQQYSSDHEEDNSKRGKYSFEELSNPCLTNDSYDSIMSEEDKNNGFSCAISEDEEWDHPKNQRHHRPANANNIDVDMVNKDRCMSDQASTMKTDLSFPSMSEMEYQYTSPTRTSEENCLAEMFDKAESPTKSSFSYCGSEIY